MLVHLLLYATIRLEAMHVNVQLDSVFLIMLAMVIQINKNSFSF